MIHIFKIILSIVCVFMIFESNAQIGFKKGFIITLDNDTLQGFVKNGGELKNSKKCVFKTPITHEKKKYGPSEIKGYCIDGTKFYLSKKINNNKGSEVKFLNVLLLSDASLFLKYGLFKNSYYFENKEDKKLIYLNNKEKTVRLEDNYVNVSPIQPKYEFKLYNKLFQDSLYSNMKDCKKVANHVLLVKFNDQSLINFIKEYNIQSSIKNEPVLYEKNINITKRRFGIFTGIRSSAITINGFTDQKAYALSLPIGVSYTIPLKPISDKLNLQIELIGNRTYHNETYLTTDKIHQINTRITSMEIPILIKYELVNRRLTPSIAIGKDFGRNLFSNTKLVHSSRKTGLFLDYGLSYQLKNHNLVYANFRANAYNGLILKNKDHQSAKYMDIIKNSFFQNRFQVKMLTFYIGYKF